MNMSATGTACDGGVRVTGDVLLPSSEPLLSVLMATDEIEGTATDGEFEGTIQETGFETEKTQLPEPVEADWAYTASVAARDGRQFQLVQPPRGTLQLVEGGKAAQVSAIHITRD